MQAKDYYRILGISPTASFHAVKTAYRQLAKKHHPDKNPNAGVEQHRLFAEIAEAYSVLSNLKKRKAYDATHFQPPPGEPAPWFVHSHYSGYPYFQWDIFTPRLHYFFMRAGEKPRSRNEILRAVFFNTRTLAISLIGALYFFKFFLAIDGVVLEKQVTAGNFNETAYTLTFETEEGKKKKKRIKSEIFDIINKGDKIHKSYFSFVYQINSQEINPVTIPRFLLQTAFIYLAISCGLSYLEFSRK